MRKLFLPHEPSACLFAGAAGRGFHLHQRICRQASKKATNSSALSVVRAMGSDAGRWMYPRAADLTSSAVQQYSDCELFWIVKNGICLSGMPAFGKVESDEHIWNLVHFVRTLPRGTDPKSGGTTN